MPKLTTLLLLLFFNSIANSQNIYSALQLNQNREYKTVKPKKIVETNIFFSANEKLVNKNIKTFDEGGMLIIEERYDDNGVLTARLTYANDTLSKIKLSRVFERWTQFGYSKETAFYSYDSNKFLVGTIDKDATGNVIQQTNLVCNDKGHPIELSLFDSNGNLFGKEIATYLYDKNKVVTSVISNDGKLLSTDTIKISFKMTSSFPGHEEVYNQNGDVTTWTRKNLDRTATIFEEEYTYDKFGNCTENKIYKVTVKGNGKRKREKDRIFKKEYSY